MYKVIIVDDDPIIRKGLRSILDWESLGCTIIGDANDGLKGLALVKELSPDLILTDIKMPNMTGLEMIEEVRKFNKNLRVIIITAFRNFEYAKKALKHDVVDLILKPTKIDDLIRSVKQSTEYLEDVKHREEELIYQKKLFNENLPLLKEKFLHDLIFGIENPDGSEKERLELFNINLSKFYILIIRFTGVEELTRYNLYLRQIGISKLCNEVYASNFNVQKIQFRTIQSAFLLTPTSDNKNHLSELRNLSEELIQIVKSSINIEISIGLSSCGSQLTDLTSCYKEATLALEKVFFTGSEVVLEYQNETNLEKSSINSNIDLLLMAIRVGNSEKVQSWFEQLTNISLQNTISISDAKNICGEIYMKIINVQTKSNRTNSDTLDILKTIYESTEFSVMINIIKNVALELSNNNSNVEKKSLSKIVQQTKETIKSNYNNSITLVTLAEQVLVSPSYLSRIFKKVEGITLNEYINKIRINKAIYLLRNTKLKSYQVAESVGIQDPHYFSRIFKKITGVNPSSYRD